MNFMAGAGNARVRGRIGVCCLLVFVGLALPGRSDAGIFKKIFHGVTGIVKGTVCAVAHVACGVACGAANIVAHPVYEAIDHPVNTVGTLASVGAAVVPGAPHFPVKSVVTVAKAFAGLSEKQIRP